MTRISIWKDYVNWSEETIVQICGRFRVVELNQTCVQDIHNVRYIAKRIKDTLGRIETDNKSRKRRSLMDGGGKLSKFLFGTMDQEDADEIHSRLKNLETDDKQNLELIKEQVSLVKSNYEANSQNFEKIHADLEEIREYTENIIKTYNSSVRTVLSETNTLKSRIAVDEAATNIIVQLEEIEHQISDLYVMLGSLSNKRLHPLILSYQQVSELISNAPSSYPLNRVLQDSLLMQHLATVESAQIDEIIFCKISVPLIQKEWFSLKKDLPATNF